MWSYRNTFFPLNNFLQHEPILTISQPKCVPNQELFITYQISLNHPELSWVQSVFKKVPTFLRNYQDSSATLLKIDCATPNFHVDRSILGRWLCATHYFSRNLAGSCSNLKFKSVKLGQHPAQHFWKSIVPLLIFT